MNPLVKTPCIDVLYHGRTIVSVDANHGGTREAFRTIAEKWRGGVIAKAQDGDTTLDRDEVLGIPRWRQELQFKTRFMSGATDVHKHTAESQQLADAFGAYATKAMHGCIGATVEANREAHAELLRKNASKYEDALRRRFGVCAGEMGWLHPLPCHPRRTAAPTTRTPSDQSTIANLVKRPPDNVRPYAPRFNGKAHGEGMGPPPRPRHASQRRRALGCLE